MYLIGYSYFTSVIDGNHASMAEFWQHWPVFYNTLLASVMLPLSLITLVFTGIYYIVSATTTKNSRIIF